MMPPAGELNMPPKNDFEIRTTPSEDVLDARLDFVKDMEWFDDQHVDDRDRYDAEGRSFHFTRRKGDEVLATMRLSSVESIEESLSYEMISANSVFQESVLGAAEEVMGEGDIWDLTRLVHPLDGRHDKVDVEEAIVELFGMAAQVSAEQATEDKVYWVFSTTSWALRFFRGVGIDLTVLASGKLPDAEGRPRVAHFCVVDLASAAELLKDHDVSYGQFMNGARMAETESVYV